MLGWVPMNSYDLYTLKVLTTVENFDISKARAAVAQLAVATHS